MGLLDSVIGSVLGGGASSPMGAILGQILGGGRSTGQGGIGGMLGSLGGGVPQGGGGFSGLLGQLRGAGLGSQVESWIGGGQNQPVSPDQLQNAFGPDQVNSWANQAGMEPHSFLSQLSQHLPHAVDQMTPDGRVPDEGTVSV